MAEHCTIHVILLAHAAAIWPSTVPLMWFYQLMLLPYGRALYHSCDSISSCCCHMAEHCTIHVILLAHAAAIWPSTVPFMWFYQLMLLPYGRALYHSCDSISSCCCHMAEHCTIHVILSAHAAAIWPSTVPFMWFYQLMLLPYGRALYHSCDSISSCCCHMAEHCTIHVILLAHAAAIWPSTVPFMLFY